MGLTRTGCGRGLWLTLGIMATVTLLVMSPFPASASVYGTEYPRATATVQPLSVSLVAGTSGTSTVSPVAPDAAAVSVNSVIDLDYLSIVLTNNQASATPSNFQQLVTINPSSYTPYEAADLGNVRFCADSGCHTMLRSWLEGCSSATCNTAASAVFWVNLGSSTIPGSGGTLTVYLGFLPTSVGFDGAYAGEAPQLSATYGQYDNGGTVFAYYSNGESTSGLSVVHGGTVSLTTQTNPYGSSSSVITLTGPGSTATSSETVAWVTASVTGDNFIAEGWVNIGTNLNGLFAVRGSSSTSITDYLIGDGWAVHEASVSRETGTTNTLLAGSGTRSAGWYWDQAVVSGTSLTANVYSGGPPELSGSALSSTAGATDSSISGKNSYLGVATWAGSTSPAYFFQWRVRSYPPGGSMPTQSVGSVTPGIPGFTVPVTLANSQSAATPTPFQQSVTFNPSAYSNFEAPNLGNIRFCTTSACTTLLNAWLEGCTPSCTSAAASATAWVKLTSSISAGGSLTIYIEFLPAATNFDGVYWGEAPALSGTYGQYDNGASVFTGYYAGASTTGWTVVGTAGSTASAPAGSAAGFGTNAFYANSANGDYMDTNAGYAGTGNYIIQYYAYTTGLGNLFFSASPTGAGTMSRLDSRGGADYAGLARTSSWTSWYCPATTTTLSAATWYQFSVVISGSGTQIGNYYTTSFGLGTVGAQINALGATYTDGCGGGSETYSPQGSYIGLVGDALGGSYVTYWNGVVIRAYPPNGVMPSVTFGSVGLNNVLGISNGAPSSWNVNLAVASSSNTGRLYNLTIWLYAPTTTETRLGSAVSQLTTGPAVALAGSGSLYLGIYAAATSSGTTTLNLAITIKGSTTAYTEYTLALTVN